MPAWSNDEEWQGLVDGSRCPICLRGVPLAVIAPMTASWLTMPASRSLGLIEDGRLSGVASALGRVFSARLSPLGPAWASKAAGESRSPFLDGGLGSGMGDIAADQRKKAAQRTARP